MLIENAKCICLYVYMYCTMATCCTTPMLELAEPLNLFYDDRIRIQSMRVESHNDVHPSGSGRAIIRDVVFLNIVNDTAYLFEYDAHIQLDIFQHGAWRRVPPPRVEGEQWFTLWHVAPIEPNSEVIGGFMISEPFFQPLQNAHYRIRLLIVDMERDRWLT